MLEFEHLQNNTSTFLDHLNSNKFRHDSPTPHRKSEKESDPDAHQVWPRGHGPHPGGSSDPWRRRSPQRGPPLRTAAAWHCGVRRGREGRRAQVRPSTNSPLSSGEWGGRKPVGWWTQSNTPPPYYTFLLSFWVLKLWDFPPLIVGRRGRPVSVRKGCQSAQRPSDPSATWLSAAPHTCGARRPPVRRRCST